MFSFSIARGKSLRTSANFDVFFRYFGAKKHSISTLLAQLDIVHSGKADVCFLEVVKPSRFTSKSRIDGSYFVPR